MWYVSQIDFSEHFCFQRNNRTKIWEKCTKIFNHENENNFRHVLKIIFQYVWIRYIIYFIFKTFENDLTYQWSQPILSFSISIRSWLCQSCYFWTKRSKIKVMKDEKSFNYEHQNNFRHVLLVFCWKVWTHHILYFVFRHFKDDLMH